MSTGLILLLTSFITLFHCSKELPLEGSTFPPEVTMITDHFGGPLVDGDKSTQRSFNKVKNEDLEYTVDRLNYSRMLMLSTTLGYDEWWFLTTRRPHLSLKDFPGRPGVATWKEISPSSGENRKSRKMNGPTAAGVSSGSWSLLMNSHYTQTFLQAVSIIFVFKFCYRT